MANLTENQQFDAVTQLETTDVVVAGPGGTANLQPQQLVNRTAYLKKHVDDLESGDTPTEKANKLTTARTLAISGAVTGSATFDGSGDATINVALADSPALTGTPTAPTAAPGTNTQQLSTTAFVQAALAALVASSPGALDTLNELAAALGNDANFATTITNALALKAPLNAPELVNPTGTTQAPGDNSTKLATTAFVQAAFTGRKNSIINGNFDIWQRGTSQTSSAYGSDDRWYNIHVGSTKTHSQQAFTLGQTDVPNEPTYFSSTIVTSVAGVGNYCDKHQRIESVRTLAGKTVTLSFYAKADASKNIAVEFLQNFGSGGSPSAGVTGIGVTTCALTTAWKKFTVTASIPSIAGKTLGSNSNDSLYVYFWFDAGSSFNARTNSLGQQSGTFDIAQVQLEEGSVATNFEYRPIATELALCQRYYEKLDGMMVWSGNTTTGNVYYIQGVFKVNKRALPTVTMSDIANVGFPANSYSFSDTKTTDFVVSKTSNTTGSGNYFESRWTADAEL